MASCDVLIVGAGFAGAVLAERLANELNLHCVVVDRRDHIAGNAYDRMDAAGVLIHPYGPHYFRTNSQRVIDYLSRFTEWHPVTYKVLSWTQGRYWSFPINLLTFEQLLGRPSTPEEMVATLTEWRVPIASPRNSEEVIVSQVGWKLYEMFFRNYTRKQWQRDPAELDASVCGRIPIRTTRDDRYLDARFQALPAEGYTRLFERMLDHPRIEVRLGTDFREAAAGLNYRKLIYTGPIDAYFDHCEGRLPYRSLRFEPQSFEEELRLPAMQVNYPNDHDYTREVEIKHATGQQCPWTTVVREFPQTYDGTNEPYYPIPAPDARALYARYAERAAAEKDVLFVGRLATYRYYNMDQVVALALEQFEKLRPAFAPKA